MQSPKLLSIEDFVYELPDNRIAKHPMAMRDQCKLLVADSNSIIADTTFCKLPDYLSSDCRLVYNNTRVINARLRFSKISGAVIEVFCLEPVSPSDYQLCFSSIGKVTWKCFVGNSKRWKEGTLDGQLTIDGTEIILSATRLERGDGDSIIELSWNNPNFTFAKIIEAAGEIPIPPYLNRKTEKSDTVDYQTVFANIEGSVAAPTAGLHFTPTLLETLKQKGIEEDHVTLHVGAGTFQPVKSNNIGGHEMHSEYIVVDRNLIERLFESDRPIVAVGTTSVRTLESLYHIGCLISTNNFYGEVPQWYPYTAEHPNLSTKQALKCVLDWLKDNGNQNLIASTRIIIAPGYKYRLVSQMITNFHQPGSTLLLLVSAFIGDNWKKVYDHALNNNYRFLSYGDACLFRQ